MNLESKEFLFCVCVCAVVSFTSAEATAIYSDVTGHWYELNLTELAWLDAQAYATSVGGYLATITSQQENLWISQNFDIDTTLPLLGGTDIAVEGVWEWNTGEPWSYSNWYSGEPNNLYPEDVLRFHPYWNNNHGYYWNDVRVETPYYSLIEYDSNPVPEPAIITLLGIGLVGSLALKRRRCRKREEAL